MIAHSTCHSASATANCLLKVQKISKNKAPPYSLELFHSYTIESHEKFRNQRIVIFEKPSITSTKDDSKERTIIKNKKNSIISSECICRNMNYLADYFLSRNCDELLSENKQQWKVGENEVESNLGKPK